MALTLFGVFAVCVLLVLLLGADVYQRLTERDSHGYDRRTAAQYITTKVRQADVAESICVSEFDGVETLVFVEEIGGEVYETKLYCYEGWLMELFSAAGNDLSPADGEKILETEAVDFTLEDGLLQVNITMADGTEQALSLHLRSGEGAYHEK